MSLKTTFALPEKKISSSGDVNCLSEPEREGREITGRESGIRREREWFLRKLTRKISFFVSSYFMQWLLFFFFEIPNFVGLVVL